MASSGTIRTAPDGWQRRCFTVEKARKLRCDKLGQPRRRVCRQSSFCGSIFILFAAFAAPSEVCAKEPASDHSGLPEGGLAEVASGQWSDGRLDPLSWVPLMTARALRTGPDAQNADLETATLGKAPGAAGSGSTAGRAGPVARDAAGSQPSKGLGRLTTQALPRPFEALPGIPWERQRQNSVSLLCSAVSARESGFALQLDDGTRKSHSIAENSAFVTGFFRGLTQKKQFSQLVADLYFVYDAMETAFTETGDANVRMLDYPELRRVPALEKDMQYCHGDAWRTSVKPTPATARYVDRIKQVAREQPVLLIAHQYTRYLGDLFGGQMMGDMARRSLDLEDGKGTAFYTFEEIPQTKEFISSWYAQVNSLKLTESEKEAIVDEANIVFRYNIELFDELEGNPAWPMFCLALDALQRKLGLKK